MHKLAFATSILFVAGVAFADRPTGDAAAPQAGQPTMEKPQSSPTCFQLSKDGKQWSKTPEVMCIGPGNKNVEIKLTTGMPPSPTDVAMFHLDLKERVRCLDCNKDVFALTNPENSVFNQLQISFDGKRDAKAGTETGTLMIGKTKFYYRKPK